MTRYKRFLLIILLLSVLGVLMCCYKIGSNDNVVNAVLLSGAITVMLWLLDWVPVAKAPMILIINCDDVDAEERIITILKKYVRHFTVKTRNLTSSSLDITIELRTDDGSKLVREFG